MTNTEYEMKLMEKDHEINMLRVKSEENVRRLMKIHSILAKKFEELCNDTFHVPMRMFETSFKPGEMVHNIECLSDNIDSQDFLPAPARTPVQKGFHVYIRSERRHAHAAPCYVTDYVITHAVRLRSHYAEISQCLARVLADQRRVTAEIPLAV